MVTTQSTSIRTGIVKPWPVRTAELSFFSTNFDVQLRLLVERVFSQIVVASSGVALSGIVLSRFSNFFIAELFIQDSKLLDWLWTKPGFSFLRFTKRAKSLRGIKWYKQAFGYGFFQGRKRKPKPVVGRVTRLSRYMRELAKKLPSQITAYKKPRKSGPFLSSNFFRKFGSNYLSNKIQFVSKKIKRRFKFSKFKSLQKPRAFSLPYGYSFFDSYHVRTAYVRNLGRQIRRLNRGKRLRRRRRFRKQRLLRRRKVLRKFKKGRNYKTFLLARLIPRIKVARFVRMRIVVRRRRRMRIRRLSLRVLRKRCMLRIRARTFVIWKRYKRKRRLDRRKRYLAKQCRPGGRLFNRKARRERLRKRRSSKFSIKPKKQRRRYSNFAYKARFFSKFTRFCRFRFYQLFSRIYMGSIFRITGIPVYFRLNFVSKATNSTYFFLNYLTTKLYYRYILTDVVMPIVRMSLRYYRGFRITCKGRFTRAQIASEKTYTRGSLQQSNVAMPVDYGQKFVVLKYGTCNFKIWVRY